MTQTYSVVLNSTITSTNKSGNNSNLGYTYYINWESILPDPKLKYKVSFTFRTLNRANFTECYQLYMNFGTSNMYDINSSRTTYLGLIYPVPTTTTVMYGMASLNDNAPITINYPANKVITATFSNANTAATGVYLSIDYVLTLNFTPIMEGV